ncbi:MAG: hypothetical protein KAW17_00230 [Candidatus Eisenbacteria sp.]|nr:hypothetical protein [Candidatus Eisenbacteria bacterium]
MSRVVRACVLLVLIAVLLVVERHTLGERHAFRLAAGWSPVLTGSTLRRLSFGYDQVAADVMWIRGLQYYGKQRLSRSPMPRLAEYLDAAVALDPHFIAAYIFGGIVLAQDLNQGDAAVDLLLRGIAANPKSWELPFELGFLLYITLDDPYRGGKYFEVAVTREGCPAMARRLAAGAYAKSGSRSDVRKVCEEIMEMSDNEGMMEFARRALAKIRMEENLEYLQMGIAGFRERVGTWPPDLESLVGCGDLTGIPSEPEGGFYAYRPETGEVGSSLQIQLALDRHFRELEDAIARYKAERGRVPTGLEELVVEGFVGELQTIFGYRFAYDPSSGRIWAMDAWRT